MGDFEKAYAKTGREDLANLVYRNAGIRGGAFVSLCSAFSWDEVVVFSSGASSVRQSQGLPEGGTLGATCYTTLPGSLIKTLEEKGQVWRGTGSLREELVLRLMMDLSSL